jgi:hypothetical protein
MEALERFDFLTLPTDFVVKPNNGLGGEGIVVIEQRGTYAGEWIDSQGVTWTVPDLKLHIGDILAGRYSMDDLPDTAYIEERVRVHPTFAKYSYHGTPDIRVIVYNRIPIMSYVRLPTEEAGGQTCSKGLRGWELTWQRGSPPTVCTTPSQPSFFLVRGASLAVF